MITPYLDKEGREMRPDKKPVFVRDGEKAQSYARVACYVQCERPDIQGLIWIGNCEKCKHFKGHKMYHGVNCAIKTNTKK